SWFSSFISLVIRPAGPKLIGRAPSGADRELGALPRKRLVRTCERVVVVAKVAVWRPQPHVRGQNSRVRGACAEAPWGHDRAAGARIVADMSMHANLQPVAALVGTW